MSKRYDPSKGKITLRISKTPPKPPPPPKWNPDRPIWSAMAYDNRDADLGNPSLYQDNVMRTIVELNIEQTERARYSGIADGVLFMLRFSSEAQWADFREKNPRAYMVNQ